MERRIEENQAEKKDKPPLLKPKEEMRTALKEIPKNTRAIERGDGNEIEEGEEKIHKHDRRDERRKTRARRQELCHTSEKRRRQHVRRGTGERGEERVPTRHAEISWVHRHRFAPAEAEEKKEQRPPEREVLEGVERQAPGIRCRSVAERGSRPRVPIFVNADGNQETNHP